jgi:hypothetical protein
MEDTLFPQILRKYKILEFLWEKIPNTTGYIKLRLGFRIIVTSPTILFESCDIVTDTVGGSGFKYFSVTCCFCEERFNILAPEFCI